MENDNLSVVDYNAAKANAHEWKRVLWSLGFDANLPIPEAMMGNLGEATFGSHTGPPNSSKSVKVMSKLVSIFDSNISCDICHRSFVNEASLSKHRHSLHNISNAR